MSRGRLGVCAHAVAGDGLLCVAADVQDADRTVTVQPCRSFCVAGVSQLCEAGRWGNEEGLSSPSCSGTCNPGRYGGTAGLQDPECTGPCSAGYFCLAGSSSPTASACPAGKYSEEGAFECIGCDEGFYCPVASVSSQQVACGGASFFCEAEAGAPTAVTSGWFSTPTTNVATQRSGQTACPAGSYCLGGVARLCPRGTWGNEEGLADAGCSGMCAGGYYGSADGQVESTCVRGHVARRAACVHVCVRAQHASLCFSPLMPTPSVAPGRAVLSGPLLPGRQPLAHAGALRQCQRLLSCRLR